MYDEKAEEWMTMLEQGSTTLEMEKGANSCSVPIPRTFN
jgi:hypothetical protein